MTKRFLVVNFTLRILIDVFYITIIVQKSFSTLENLFFCEMKLNNELSPSLHLEIELHLLLTLVFFLMFPSLDLSVILYNQIKYFRIMFQVCNKFFLVDRIFYLETEVCLH